MVAEWKSAGYDESPSGGDMCWRCGALVPAIGLAGGRRATDLHDEWHQQVDGLLSGR